jgi:hypothetical protein
VYDAVGFQSAKKRLARSGLGEEPGRLAARPRREKREIRRMESIVLAWSRLI